MGMGWYLVKPLWNLCDYFLPLCAFVIILWDVLKYNLIGVVLTYSFNFRRQKLINLESSVGAFLLTTLCLIYLVITITFHLFTALAEYQP
jgi:hypothetical protein